MESESCLYSVGYQGCLDIFPQWIIHYKRISGFLRQANPRDRLSAISFFVLCFDSSHPLNILWPPPPFLLFIYHVSLPFCLWIFIVRVWELPGYGTFTLWLNVAYPSPLRSQLKLQYMWLIRKTCYADRMMRLTKVLKWVVPLKWNRALAIVKVSQAALASSFKH